MNLAAWFTGRFLISSDFLTGNPRGFVDKYHFQGKNVEKKLNRPLYSVRDYVIISKSAFCKRSPLTRADENGNI